MSSKHTPTEYLRGKVEGLAASGMTAENVAGTLGLSLSTIRRHYKRELQLAQAQRVAAVAGSLYEVAMSPKHSMAKVVSSIFLLKTQGKWRESQVISHENADGSPIAPAQTVQIVLPSNQRNNELAAKLGLLKAAPPMQIEADQEALAIAR